MEPNEQFIVGAEHDQALFKRLGNVLRSLGYDFETNWQGVGGSQDISHWVVIGPKGHLTVEAETYIGLSVSGSPELLAEVKSRLAVAR